MDEVDDSVALRRRDVIAVSRLLWSLGSEDSTSHQHRIDCWHWGAVLDAASGLPPHHTDEASRRQLVAFYEDIRAYTQCRLDDLRTASKPEDVTVVRAELKSVVLWTLDAPSRDIGPDDRLDDPEHFGLGAQVFIGTADGALSDSFDIMIASASWLAERQNEGWEGFEPGRLAGMPPTVLISAGVLLMSRWSWQDFETAVRVVCDYASPGPDWGAVASRIGRFLPWEFDYSYDEHVNDRYGDRFPLHDDGQTPDA